MLANELCLDDFWDVKKALVVQYTVQNLSAVLY